MDAPMDPCLGLSSISRMPTLEPREPAEPPEAPEPPEVPPITARASPMSRTPYPMWWIPSPRRSRNLPTGVSGASGSSSWT